MAALRDGCEISSFCSRSLFSIKLTFCSLNEPCRFNQRCKVVALPIGSGTSLRFQNRALPPYR
jgi:hypothetical protein